MIDQAGRRGDTGEIAGANTIGQSGHGRAQRVYIPAECVTVLAQVPGCFAMTASSTPVGVSGRDLPCPHFGSFAFTC